MKKIVSAIIIVLLLPLTLAGCSLDSSKKESSSSGSDVTIGVSLSTLNNPFFVSMKNAIESEANKNNYKVKITDAQDSSSKQLNDIDDLIQQKVNYLIVNPTDSAAVSSAVESANKEGIPVITLDRSVEEGEVAQFIASDNVEGGKMAGQFVLEKLGKGAKVAELEGVPGASATRERGKGFHLIADNELNVVTKQTANFNRAEGLNVVQNMLQANPDIKAIFAHNDEMALGAIEAIGDKDILVVGFDGNEDAIKSIQDKKLDATIAQQPKLMGEEAVKSIHKLKSGTKVEKEVKVSLKLEKQA